MHILIASGGKAVKPMKVGDAPDLLNGIYHLMYKECVNLLQLMVVLSSYFLEPLLFPLVCESSALPFMCSVHCSFVLGFFRFWVPSIAFKDNGLPNILFDAHQVSFII